MTLAAPSTVTPALGRGSVTHLWNSTMAGRRAVRVNATCVGPGLRRDDVGGRGERSGLRRDDCEVNGETTWEVRASGTTEVKR